ncbi:MAG TPA: helix-turn-helix transcriptional regulator [Candidatus Dormibacteraeota bacterium]|nr:helix-turn-helix transcriptional regulator [Candidatus Dormibacteraeota bacterium]
MADVETLGQRIRRIRHERGMSLAKVSGGDFSRAFLNQVEFGRAQPSTRVLRVIAVRLGTDVDYLLDGRAPALERELALEKARVLLARGEARKALLCLQPLLDSTEWPLGTDARLCQAEALYTLGRSDEAAAVASREKLLITARSDRHRLERLRAIQRGKPFAFSGDAAKAHLRLADRAQRAANDRDALEHYRAARVLLEAAATPRSGR